jgi:palmitoyltransferase
MFTAGMSISSTNFALLNVTQVEHLGMATRVYDFAVLKSEQSVNSGASFYFREITYPLPMSTEGDPPGSDIAIPKADDLVAVGGQAEHANNPRREKLSERDLQATRSFVVLRTEPGENPWDLGSNLLNWETVMGTNPIDWLLPVRRSPCCNHDDQESFYFLGPTADLMRSRAGWMDMSTVRVEGGRKRSGPINSKKREKFVETQRRLEEMRANRYKKEPSAETPNASNDTSRNQQSSSIEMDFVNGQTPTLRAA